MIVTRSNCFIAGEKGGLRSIWETVVFTAADRVFYQAWDWRWWEPTTYKGQEGFHCFKRYITTKGGQAKIKSYTRKKGLRLKSVEFVLNLWVVKFKVLWE